MRPPAPRIRRIGIGPKLFLAAFGACLALLSSEGVLRLTAAEYHVMPEVQFGWPDSQTIHDRYAPDPDLLWVTRDYRHKLRAARTQHPQIVFLGDSCTEFGTYPEKVLDRLRAGNAPVTSGIALATGGWSSEQGLEQLRRDVIGLRPRVVILYFGWNDHWMALGPTDSQLQSWRWWLPLAEHSRLLQQVLKVRMGLLARNPERPNRVPPERYVANLESMGSLSTHAGIVPIFVTAPSNHVAGHEPSYLQQRHLQHLSELVPVHHQYADLTRRAARMAGVLCDAANAFDHLQIPKAPLFMADGIHFTARGDEVLADVVSQCITQAIK